MQTKTHWPLIFASGQSKGTSFNMGRGSKFWDILIFFLFLFSPTKSGRFPNRQIYFLSSWLNNKLVQYNLENIYIDLCSQSLGMFPQYQSKVPLSSDPQSSTHVIILAFSVVTGRSLLCEGDHDLEAKQVWHNCPVYVQLQKCQRERSSFEAHLGSNVMFWQRNFGNVGTYFFVEESDHLRRRHVNRL